MAEARLAFDNEDSDKDGLLSIDQAFLYYFELSRTIYEQQPSRADFDDFWKKEGLKVDENNLVKREDLLKASGHQWRMKGAQLQDIEITIYEVDETFPSMYFMQRIIKQKTTFIYGVQKEMLTWNKRIRKHQKNRAII